MTQAIKINNLKYTYDDKDTVFDDFNLEINAGQWLALVGHNGSGKSTLAKLILGLIEADNGTITVFGEQLRIDTVHHVREQIGMVFQNPDNQFVGATVADDVAFGLENKEMLSSDMPNVIDEALTIVGMQDFKDREPHMLSGGQKQRVALASVLALQPKIIILDEATAMLDPDGRATVMATLQDLKQRFGSELTLITITHDMNEAMLADRVVVINDGQLILDGAPSEVFSQYDVMHHNGLELPFVGELAVRLDPKPDGYLDERELIKWLSDLKK
ncbi:energy-coupling factor transporter ATPase [Leuconostoc gasicomitatum]|uniref:energy-coupling factor transporter ATPase n=1 Tax=Leuconostoc gasicomitatum TaxID=115778 RepID=UPI000BD5A727|nr:energy-coupling factor transporter ATPase [Leuconostoc gasicomitatum]MBZ5945031.1 energy-coupling factor transporter ATPase [Leuconostoc gasicomitatum]MBZ5949885.1 energy-coupling factor transporter ATPase [Leuconostoc gasicomitatum]MBZ5952287.1 energy-coupling factor transporter ATPase [Leuconostoc gasicomitatum]MBZ5967799.1 energy-coupling factor transporter ATPase [Leuconostoc gasicomitatum]MBZ5971062.1 energy-coupling factor transporter ATPase [Leuconostoc gasicomitatum]